MKQKQIKISLAYLSKELMLNFCELLLKHMLINYALFNYQMLLFSSPVVKKFCTCSHGFGLVGLPGR
jgi:hypothetical protein